MIVINTAAWAWPQWTFLALCTLDVLVHAYSHGTPKGNYNIGNKAIDCAVLIALLSCGGFFS